MVHDDGDRIWCRSVLDKHSSLLGDAWRWAKELTGGPGGSVVIRKAADETATPAIPRAKRKRKAKVDPEKAKAIPLSEVEKARAYEQERSRKLKALIAGRSLELDDRLALQGRGVTSEECEELESLGFVSIKEGTVSLAAAGAPGIDDFGNYGGPTGFLIPAFRIAKDGTREYLGMQIATCKEFRDDVNKGKYLWLSMGNQIESSRSEHFLSVTTETGGRDSMPMFSHIGGDRIDMAFLCDGALKTYLTASRQKQAAFGAPGAMFSSSMGQLRDGLMKVVGLNGRVKIAIAADAGDPKNRLIMEQLTATASAIREWGFQIDWVDLKQEEGKAGGEDIDETNAAVEDLISEADFFQKMTPGLRREVRKGVAKRWEYGFRPMKDDDTLEPQLGMDNPTLYEKGGRTQKLAELLEQGCRMFVDASTTGAGKSFWWSHLEQKDLDLLGVEQVVVLSERYLEQAEEFGVGMVRGRQAQGVKRTDEGRLFTIQHGEQLAKTESQELKSNCANGETLAKFMRGNMAMSLSSLCTHCPYKDACETSSGAYRYDRAAALKEKVLVMHPQSMQDQFVQQLKDGEEGGLQIPKTGVVLDDVALAQLTETVAINRCSAEESLSPLVDLLGQSAGVSALLGAVRNGKSMTSSELRNLCLHEVQSGMPRTGWAALIEQEEIAVGGADVRLHRKCWLSYLKSWAEGNAVGYIDHNGNLIFKTFNHRLRNALHNAAWVLFLDATASPLVLEKLMGSKPEMIAEKRWRSPADLNIRQVRDMGLLGYNRSDQKNFQIKVALSKLKKKGLLPYESTAVIDTKAGLELSKKYGVVSMAYLSDSRGSNRAYEAKCSTLLMIGSPNTNLGDAVCTFELLFGEAVDLEARRPVVYPVLQEEGTQPMVCCEVGSQHPGFSAFYAHLRRAELLQALGRLRHQIREGEKLEVIVLGDTLMPFAVRLMELSEVLDDDNMADWASCNDRTLSEAAASLRSERKVVTIEAVAMATGLHPKLVEEWVHAFGPTWLEEKIERRVPATPAHSRRAPYPRRRKRRMAV